MPSHRRGLTPASSSGIAFASAKPGMQSAIGAHCSAIEGGLSKCEYRASIRSAADTDRRLRAKLNPLKSGW